MRLLVPSASLSTAIAASQAFLHTGSASAVANIVDFAYENEIQIAKESFSAYEECFLESLSNLSGTEADVGILFGCSDPEYVCVEDITSGLGGRCAPAATDQRELATTSCTKKCTGNQACEGLSATFINNSIGEGSCCGDNACKGVSAFSKIGKGSCIGYKNCFQLQNATIGDRSCTGDSIKGEFGDFGFACAYARGSIGSDSCFEYASCYQTLKDSNMMYSFNISNSACRGESACEYSTDYRIGDNSCAGRFACSAIYAEIAHGSCNGDYSCYGNRGSIGANSCNGTNACYKQQASGTIGMSSCNAKRACDNNTASIGNSICNTGYACQNNAAPLTSDPNKMPSKRPTGRSKSSKPPKSTKSSKPQSAKTSKPTVDQGESKSGKRF